MDTWPPSADDLSQGSESDHVRLFGVKGVLVHHMPFQPWRPLLLRKTFNVSFFQGVKWRTHRTAETSHHPGRCRTRGMQLAAEFYKTQEPVNINSIPVPKPPWQTAIS
jgi:hypothetical protein